MKMVIVTRLLLMKYADAAGMGSRVATHLENLENLEKSGNSKMVMETSGK